MLTDNAVLHNAKFVLKFVGFRVKYRFIAGIWIKTLLSTNVNRNLSLVILKWFSSDKNVLKWVPIFCPWSIVIFFFVLWILLVFGKRTNHDEGVWHTWTIGMPWISFSGLRIEFSYVLHGKSYINDSKVHGAKMGPIWGSQDPGGPHVGPMNFAIWASSKNMHA